MLVVGNTIGVGIFTSTGIVAEHVPDAGLLLGMWFVGGLLSLAGALTWSELATLFPHAGGEYVYLRETFGPMWGFLSGWAAFIANFSGSIAVLAIALATYVLSPFVGSNSATPVWTMGAVLTLTWVQGLGIVLVWAFSILNYLGMQFGSVIQNIVSVSKLLAIFALVVVGFGWGQGDWNHFVLPASHGAFGSLGFAFIPIIFTYSGWNAVAYVASEVREPGTLLPLALALGTLITIGVYLLLNVLYLYAVPIPELRGAIHVGELAASALFGSTQSWPVAAIIALSIGGALNVMILTGGRIYYAMACDGVFFSQVANVHPRFRTPGTALLFQAAWSSVLILSGTFEQLLTYTTFTLVAFSALAVSAVFVLRSRYPELPRPYAVWGYPWLPAIYLLGTTGILLSTIWERPVECGIGMGLCAVGIPVYRLWRGRNALTV